MIVGLDAAPETTETTPAAPPPQPSGGEPLFTERKILDGIAAGFLWGLGMAAASRLIEATTGRKP
jgi:hypothetical protein